MNPLGRKAGPPVERSLPRHVEIWGHIVENNRFFRRLALLCVAWASAALAVGSYGAYLGLYRPLAFHVDPDGAATYVGRLREGDAPSAAEVRFVAKRFLERYVAFNSLTIETDLAEAWNLMTDSLRALQDETLATYAREQGKEFVAYVKEQGIQTVLDFHNDRTEITNHNDKAWTMRLVGAARTWPLNRVGEEAGFTEREFEAFVTLVRCPRTEQTPNGLLVDKASTRFYVPERVEGSVVGAPPKKGTK